MKLAAGIALQVAVVTVLAAVLGASWIALTGGATNGFVEAALQQVLLFVDIAIVTWLVLLIVGGVRGRGVGWGIRGSLIAAAIGAAMNLVWILILSLAGGGVDARALALGAQADIAFLISVAVTAPLLVRLVVKAPPRVTRST